MGRVKNIKDLARRKRHRVHRSMKRQGDPLLEVIFQNPASAEGRLENKTLGGRKRKFKRIANKRVKRNEAKTKIFNDNDLLCCAPRKQSKEPAMPTRESGYDKNYSCEKDCKSLHVYMHDH